MSVSVHQPLIQFIWSRSHRPGWQTKALQDSLVPAFQDRPLASEKGRSSRRRVYCSHEAGLVREAREETGNIIEHTSEMPAIPLLMTRLLALWRPWRQIPGALRWKKPWLELDTGLHSFSWLPMTYRLWFNFTESIPFIWLQFYWLGCFIGVFFPRLWAESPWSGASTHDLIWSELRSDMFF